MQIAPTQIWINGTQRTATQFDLRIIHDDLQSKATLYFELLEDGGANDEGEALPAVMLASGNLVIEGDDYVNWSAEVDINLWVYNWALGLLNLTAV